MARRVVSKRKAKEPKISVASFRRKLYSSVLDEVEKKFDLTGSDPAKRVSTGLLVQDLICGGGLVSGMTTNFGAEASAKSTSSMHFMHSCIQTKIPIICHFDGEGTATSDINYAAAIYRVNKLEEVYGKKVNDEWVIPSKIRYYDGTVLEPTYGAMLHILNRIPDKLYRAEQDQFYYRLRVGDKRLGRFLKMGDIDSKLSDKKFIWIPTEDRYPQAAFCMDSYPVFNPESLEDHDEDDSSEAMASQALAYTKSLRRVVGRFKRKQVIVFGLNQLRQRPGQMFGNPNYEPCGNFLKLNSSIRNEFSSRYVPKEWRAKGQAQYSVEPSVERRGEDNYAYKYIKNVKNKTAPPWMEGWSRVWVKDATGVGRGFDMVFDTAQFLQMIGLAKIQSNFKSIKFHRKMDHELAGKQVVWADFKTHILMEEYPDGKYMHHVHKPIKLRAWCKKLMQSGKAVQIMQNSAVERMERKKRGADDDMESDD
jgi:RecA/RadA recombinase